MVYSSSLFSRFSYTCAGCCVKHVSRMHVPVSETLNAGLQALGMLLFSAQLLHLHVVAPLCEEDGSDQADRPTANDNHCAPGAAARIRDLRACVAVSEINVKRMH